MNSQAQEDGIVTVGRIGAPHGVKGELRVHSFTEPKENIINYLPWLVSINEQWQQIEVLSSCYNGKHIIARIAGYHDRDLAGRLCHSDVGIYHAQLPDLDSKHYYWADLLGLKVINQHSVVLGVIDSLLATGANDVMVVKGEKEHLIPFVMGEFVSQVDLDAKLVKVTWEDELL